MLGMGVNRENLPYSPLCESPPHPVRKGPRPDMATALGDENTGLPGQSSPSASGITLVIALLSTAHFSPRGDQRSSWALTLRASNITGVWQLATFERIFCCAVLPPLTYRSMVAPRSEYR